MCWNDAAAAGCVFWPLLSIHPSLARFSTVSVCPRGRPRLLPLAGTDTSKSPNCDGQAGRLRQGVPLTLTRPLFRPCTTILRGRVTVLRGRRVFGPNPDQTKKAITAVQNNSG